MLGSVQWAEPFFNLIEENSIKLKMLRIGGAPRAKRKNVVIDRSWRTEILDETMPQEETVASNVQSTEESNTWKLVVIILVFLVIAGGAALFVFQKKGKKSN